MQVARRLRTHLLEVGARSYQIGGGGGRDERVLTLERPSGGKGELGGSGDFWA